MPKKPAAVPPFAWLGRFWTPVGVLAVTGIAAFFRFYQITTLPPGLDEASARIGLQGLAVNFTHPVPSLNAANSYAPLWVWLQAIPAHLLHNGPGLRLWSALLGVAAVVMTWIWLRDWFGKRVAWAGAFTMAVSPWAVTIARSGLPSALPPLLVPFTLWACRRALRHPTSGRYAVVGAALALDLLSGPLGWLLVLTVLAVAIWRLARAHKLFADPSRRATGAAILAAGLAILGYIVAVSLTALRDLPHALSLVTNPQTFLSNLVKVLLMFNVHGDENYRHNLAPEPMLNAFVGLMMIAGLLVAVSRLDKGRYRIVMLFTLVMLIPATLTTTGTPNASWAAGALPLIFALVGIGTGYMLEMWYATFPVNSAARATGQAAIILLLTLTLLQGYTQYFKAWAGSTAVYIAYNEGANQIAARLRYDNFAGERYVVIPSDQTPVVDYLDRGRTKYRIMTPADLTALPIAATNRQFYITAASRDEAVKTLKAKFPGGVLRPLYSSFNQIEIYYIYETTK